MLRALIFKNNDTPENPTKIGKVSSALQRMIYSFTMSGKVGILKGYGNECSIKQSNVSELGTTAVTFNKGAVVVYGGICLLEQDTVLNVPNVANGSIGVLVDLSKEAGQEVELYAGDSPSAKKDNLQDKENDGVYYFELYKYSVTGVQFSAISKTNEFIQPNENLSKILDGSLPVPKASQIVPVASGVDYLTFYVGTNLVRLEW